MAIEEVHHGLVCALLGNLIDLKYRIVEPAVVNRCASDVELGSPLLLINVTHDVLVVISGGELLVQNFFAVLRLGSNVHYIIEDDVLLQGLCYIGLC